MEISNHRWGGVVHRQKQILSDTFHRARSAGSQTFYPLHVTWVSFPGACRRHHICSDYTVTPYVAVLIDVVYEYIYENTQEVADKKSEVSIVLLVRALHGRINFVLTQLMKKLFEEFLFIRWTKIGSGFIFSSCFLLLILPKPRTFCV